MQGILLIFQKIKYRGQFCPVKHIPVFIDFKHGEFFSISSLFKLLCFEVVMDLART